MLEQLLLAREKAVQEQSEKLSEALSALQQRAKDIEISQEALAHQTRLLQLIINSIGAGVIVANPQGKFLLFNPAAADIIGIGMTETLPPAWTERYGCFCPDKVTPYPAAELPLYRALKGETVRDAEMFICNQEKPQGIHIMINAAPLYGGDGAIQGGVIVFHDITALKNTAEALRRSERRFAELFLSAADPIVILSKEGKVCSMNPAAEKISGYPQTELYGRAFTEIGIIAPASIHVAVQEFMKVAAGQPAGPYELEMISKGGEIYLFEAHSTLIQNTGGADSIQVILRDTTARKRSEKRAAVQYAVSRVLSGLSRPGDALSLVLETVGESLGWELGAVWELDSSNHYLKCSKQWKRSGFFAPEFEKITEESLFSQGFGLPGRVWKDNRSYWIEDLSCDINFPRLKAAVMAGLRAGFCFPVRSGGEVTGAVEFFSQSRQKFDSGILEMFEAIGNQIGQFLERRKTEAALIEKQVELVKAQAEREQLELLAFVASHDLQQPLQKILSYADLIRTDPELKITAQSEKYLAKLEESARRMGGLVADLLKFMKASSKESMLERVNLNSVLQEVLKDFDDEIRKSRAKIEVCPLPVLKADRRQMQQLFQNLFSNALKFRKKNEPLSVVVSSRDLENGRIEIVFQDNGVGFNEEYKERLFKPFERLHDWNEYAGSGVGLAICKKIAERHQGTIQVQSAEGRGTAFFIRLPLI